MVRTLAIAFLFSLLVSAAIGFAMHSGATIGSVGLFVVSPGLIAFAANSDLLQKPPIFQTIALFVAVNAVWYLVLALCVGLARKAMFRRGLGT